MFTDELVVKVEDLTSRITFLIGKNGSGKSTQLRLLSASLAGHPEWDCRYVVPERGGALIHDAGVESQFISDPQFAFNSRRVNQLANFKQQSYVQFLRLERTVLRRIESDPSVRSAQYFFADELEKLNEILPQLKLIRTEYGFSLRNKSSGSEVHPNNISSGESELISLGIEVLEFSLSSPGKPNRLLLLDEPDVHLHPDLQSRFANFLLFHAHKYNFRVLVATHSTAFIGGLGSGIRDARIAILNEEPINVNGETLLKLRPNYHNVDKFIEKVLPIFGANPLSNIFAQKPILLVEGSDELRILEQVTRSSEGKFNFQPCPVNGKGNFAACELELEQLLNSLYDTAKGFSVRDGDGETDPLVDSLCIVRMRLACREIENLLLSDEVLKYCGTTWEGLRDKIDEYTQRNPGTQSGDAFKSFKDGGYDRINSPIKELRNTLPGLLGQNKSWEVLLGKTLAEAIKNGDFHDLPTSIKGMVGAKFWSNIIEPSIR